MDTAQQIAMQLAYKSLAVSDFTIFCPIVVRNGNNIISSSVHLREKVPEPLDSHSRSKEHDEETFAHGEAQEVEWKRAYALSQGASVIISSHDMRGAPDFQAEKERRSLLSGFC